MPGEDIQSWSVVAADNGNADSAIDWQEGQPRAAVNNSARSQMAAHAKDRNLKNGSIVTGGTANAQTFTSGVGYTTVPTGLVVKLKIGPSLTNDTAATLNMDGIGAVAIKLANGDPLHGNELVAGSYTDFLFDGANWIFLYSREFFFDLVTGGDGIVLSVQVFAIAGAFTYTPTAGMECAVVDVVGGGGGAGGAVGAGNLGVVAGGGGSGGWSRKLVQSADVGASQPVTVGAGGAGGPGANFGADGGASSFGTLCIANGGRGSQYANPGTTNGSPGGAGGVPGTGDITAAGNAGQGGHWTSGAAVYAADLANLGGGGGSVFGGGSVASANGHGVAGGQYGGGGSGAASYNGSGEFLGGAGAPGVVIITEFAGRGAPGRDGVDGAPGPIGPIGPAGPAGAGTGDVLVAGTPVTGQMARWVDTSHIEGVDAPSDFTTGDAKLTLKTTADAGWVMSNDGTIGGPTSGATFANAAAQALFNLIFANITDAYAPIFTSAGAATTRAAQGTALAAWAANCRISLTKQLGRALGVAGAGAGLTARPLGATVGEEGHVQTAAEMASHVHGVNDPGHFHPITQVPYTPATMSVDPGAAQTVPLYGGNVTSTGPTSTGINIAAAGGGAAANVMQPTAFWNVMIKL